MLDSHVIIGAFEVENERAGCRLFEPPCSGLGWTNFDGFGMSVDAHKDKSQDRKDFYYDWFHRLIIEYEAIKLKKWNIRGRLKTALEKSKSRGEIVFCHDRPSVGYDFDLSRCGLRMVEAFFFPWGMDFPSGSTFFPSFG